jgi:NADPH:quinone reductase-like Zn-dependent oxidoreductase
MRATVMHGAGDVRIETVRDPAVVEPGDAIVRVTRACICGSDLRPYKSLEPSETGRAMGHEAIGVVEDVGAGVRTVKAGDLVVMPFAFSDGTCVFCHAGLHTSCLHGGFFGIGAVGGAQAEAIRVPDVRLVVAGDGPARGELSRTAPAGTIFTGELVGDELAALYASADVFCFPSTTDTFGQVLLEAGASGLPVVAAAAGGAPELVHDGRTGRLVAPDEPHALATAILGLAADAELRRRWGAAGREAALARTWPAAIASLADVYRTVLGVRKEESLVAA